MLSKQGCAFSNKYFLQTDLIGLVSLKDITGLGENISCENGCELLSNIGEFPIVFKILEILWFFMNNFLL
jgi:hypothetical protein